MCPCVAAGAALESAVFERASCVFAVQGGRGGAHNPAKAGFWCSPLLFYKEMFGDVYRVVCREMSFPFGSNPHNFSRKLKV